MPQDARVRFDYCQTLADLQETAAALRELDQLMAASPAPPPDTVALRLRLTESTDAAAALTEPNIPCPASGRKPCVSRSNSAAPPPPCSALMP